MAVNCSSNEQRAVMSAPFLVPPCLTECVFSPARERWKTMWIVIRYPLSVSSGCCAPCSSLCGMKETQLTVCLRLSLLLRACEAESCASASFIKHQLHKKDDYRSYQPFFGSPSCKIQTHPWLNSQPADLVPLSLAFPLRLRTLMLLFASHY